MTIYETVRRRLSRAHKPLTQYIGYVNENRSDGPSLTVNLPSGYDVHISFRDLAYLVRKADEVVGKYKNEIGVPKEIQNWRDLT